MNIIKRLKKTWKNNPHFVAFLFALPIGMFVVIATFFDKKTGAGQDVYAKNYVLEQAVVLLSMGLFLFMISLLNANRKVAIISMVTIFILLQFAMIHFNILSG